LLKIIYAISSPLADFDDAVFFQTFLDRFKNGVDGFGGYFGEFLPVFQILFSPILFYSSELKFR